MGSELTGPDPSTTRQILSVALPVLGGVASAASPAGTRGLYGTIAGLQVASRLGDVRRQEQARIAQQQALGDVLGSEISPAEPEVPEIGMSTEQGPQVLRPGRPARPAQRLSDVLGPAQTSLVKGLLQAPETAGQALPFITGALKPEEYTLGEGATRYRAPFGGGPPQVVARGGQKLQRVDTVDEHGRPVTRFVRPEEGTSTPTYRAPVQMETTDAQGNPVRAFVQPEVGAAYPVSRAPQLIHTQTPEGKPTQQFVSPQAGTAYPAAPRPPQAVQTVGPTGQPETRFVQPEAGAAYPSARVPLTQTLQDVLRAGGIEPTSATPEQIAAARQQIQREHVEVSAQTGAAAVGAKAVAERQQPLGVKAASDYLLPNGQPVPGDWTEDRAIAAGARHVTPAQREQLAALDSSQAIVQSIDQFSKGLITARTPVEAYAQGAGLHTGALTRANPAAATYLDSQQAFLGILSRTMGGERGVLTDRDIGRIARSLPGFFDTATIRDAKIGLLNTLLQVAGDAQRQAILGVAPSQGSAQQIQEIMRRLEQVGTQSPQPAPGATSAAPPAGQAPPPATHRYNPKTGKIEAIR